MEHIFELFNTNMTYAQQQEVWYEFFNQILPEWLFRFSLEKGFSIYFVVEKGGEKNDKCIMFCRWSE